MTFFIPPIEVVTFRLRGLCMLGVFLLSACLEHECQDLLSLSAGNTGVNRLALDLCSHMKGFKGLESEPMLTSREKSLKTRQAQTGLNCSHKILGPTQY